MAYQAKRSHKVTEDLELINERGEVEKVIHVSLDADEMVRTINDKYIALLDAQKEAQQIRAGKDDPETISAAYEKLGNIVVDMFQAVFGVENTSDILDFYGDRTTEMCREVLPFVTQVILPRLRQISQENRKTVMQSYNRKQRRIMHRRK